MMAEKKSFLNWVGFTEEESSSLPSSVDRIRELEAQIADLKSRRDITGLTLPKLVKAKLRLQLHG